MGTMAFGNMYPSFGSSKTTQESVNPVNATGSAKVPTRHDFDIPILPGIAGYVGITVPMLLAMGVLAWFLIEKYD